MRAGSSGASPPSPSRNREPISPIQSLWAGPWLRDVAGFGRAEVASRLFTLALSMAIGFLGIGFVAERIGRRGVRAGGSPGPVCATAFQVVQGAIAFGFLAAPRLLWIAFGLFGASGMLSYVILVRRFPKDMAGRVNACLNVLVFASRLRDSGGHRGHHRLVVAREGLLDRGLPRRLRLGSGPPDDSLVWFRARFTRSATSAQEAA